MEQLVNRELQRIEKGPEPPNSLQRSSRVEGLTEEENNIYVLKYQSPAFCRLEESLLFDASQVLLLKICVITGWQMPENELQDILVDQFSKQLKEHYATANSHEMEYAFRRYGTAVPDWGKLVNLSLIHQVMGPYLSAREHVSGVEEQRALPAAACNTEGSLADVAMELWLKETKEKVMRGGLAVDFVPLPLYEWLKKSGRVKMNGKRNEYVKRACDYRQGQLNQAINNQNNHENRQALTDFMVMKSSGEITGKEVTTVENIAKKMILFDLLKSN
jgi:hypothetical protein